MRLLTTLRLDPEDYKAICLLSKKRKMKKSDVLRQTVHNGLIHLLNGEDENTLLAKRLGDRVADVDGATYLAKLKRELGR
jgi:hypothetical protein